MSEKRKMENENIENEQINSEEEIPSATEQVKVEEKEEEVLANESDKTNAELAEMRDKFLRLYSEFDNYRKRTQKERLELFKSAGEDVIVSLLPVLDDFERSMKFKEAEESDGESKTGVELIYNKLKLTLESKGLKRMNSIGEVFNDEFHEAIANIPAPEELLKGKVVDESECGYFLNTKVIRHAKVIVGN